MNILKLKKINILSVEYGIKYHKYASQVDEDENEMLQGQISYRTKTIRIKTQTEKAMIKALIHEIIHGVIHEFGIYNLMGKDENEQVTEFLSSGLTDTLIRNRLITLD